MEQLNYILIHFPPGMCLKNVFAPMQAGCQQIKKIASLSQLGGKMTKSEPQVLHRYWDEELGTTVQVGGTVVTQQMHVFVQAIFCVAKGVPITRFHAVETKDDADAV
jgi:hypothetical protein